MQDPTRPLGYQHGASVATPTLTAIWYGAERRRATINGQTLEEGAVVADSGGAQLRRIERGYVVLSRGEHQWRLNLNNESVRTPRADQ